MSNTTTVETQDILLAATLKVKGYKLAGIHVEGYKGAFLFENVTQSDVEEFDLGNSLVEPVAFNNAVKTLTASVKRKL